MSNNDSTKKVILIGLSGCSSTGKTTLAKLASQFLPNSVLIHEDDFYKHDEEVPMNTKYGIRDWDSPEALNLLLFKKELNIIKNTGQIATKLIHNNNVDNISKFALSESFLEELSLKTQSIDDKYNLVIVDGFMLYNNNDISSEFDLRLFIRAPYKTLKKRRDSRNGYQTLDSFWVDPPYYFDEFVYKSYEENHKSLFQNEDVEGKLTTQAAKEIRDFNNDDGVSIEESLSWVIDQIASFCKD
ncbi:similar to Saccharomyces cerevisiae YNL129W NRK1 Nicotinamide riboside kinase [Maudiozyma barnettii]|uniref:Similar to Saccharomyces cerevisiae YNL129W NRK1 Nicotinamide riboside kinase n=1 Tax=Maudiozyma barnettii TaxID=61262 RepID=A0A8H2ZHN6_9SACH|nr:ribosylnicotinamide kinase [Kazachstania barnettii]CAB4252309.1 similar to Saccharomyces cerevisiae YNL129W NRK1 Nicotinamide riboside kinase [Kazachstania barnettii]CAD1779037.1 similar to Saccharomyces cerevisiae YNL129W NRK1 Nicotinamide riboside kinase [Kazachstania barnettii]